MSVAIFETNPLVSVLIRSMDRASLTEALASVAAQTYQSLEVVLVNAKGGVHRDVGLQCGNVPIRLIDSGSRLARSAAANVALEQALGAYLIFLDDDDLMDAGHIASLIVALEKFPQCQAAFSGTRVTDALGVTQGVYSHTYSPQQLLVGNFLPIHAVLFSRALVQAGCRFDTTLETYEDWDFWLQVSRHTTFTPTGVVSAIYRAYLGNSGMSQADDRLLQRQRRAVIWRKWWPAWGVENIELLAADFERMQDVKAKENTELLNAFNLEIVKNTQLHHDLAAHQKLIGEQIQHVSHLGQTIADLDIAVAALKDSLTFRESELANRDLHIKRLDATIQEMLSSTSWKLSAPIRRFGLWALVVRRKTRAAALLVRLAWEFLRRDSIATQMGSAVRFVRQAGWPGVKSRLGRTPIAQPLVSGPHVSAKGLEASPVARLERHDYRPLSSIDTERYEYFFLDVFDTAVIRLVEKPVDLFKYIGHVTHDAAFESKRIHQERKTRETHGTRKDIKLREIYEGFYGADLQRETAAELMLCAAHPETLAFYADLVAKGKKIYFVSDMYIDKETLSAILHKNGFCQYEGVFVSSEDDLIKGDGSRFAWLKEVLPDSLGSAIHIGDNHVSDWVQPRVQGYDAFQYTESIEFYRYDAFLYSKAPYLVTQDSLGVSFVLGMFRYWKSGFLGHEPGYWRQFGFFYGGALVAAFCGYIHHTVLQSKLSTTRVFFLARDGDIMSKVFQLLYPEWDAVYLLASRRCMSFPSLTALNSAEDGDALKLFTTPVGITCANDLIERFGYEDLNALSTAFSDLETRGLLNSEPEILSCVTDNKEAVLAKAQAERVTLLRYLDAVGFFGDPDIVIADVGWGGSIQNALVKILNQSGVGDQRLQGIYMGVDDQVQHEDYKSGFLFRGDKSRFAGFLNLIELITSSPKDGVMRIQEVDGNFLPVSVRQHADESHRQTIAAEIQAGILEFAQIVKDRKIGQLDFLQPSDFEALFVALQEHPSNEDVEHLGGVRHAMTLGNHFGEHVLNKKG